MAYLTMAVVFFICQNDIEFIGINKYRVFPVHSTRWFTIDARYFLRIFINYSFFKHSEDKEDFIFNFYKNKL